MPVLATCLGYPRFGVARELKKALESYWSKSSPASDLEATASMLRRRHWSAMRSLRIDQIPSNDSSLYDHMLDMAVAVGAVPARYRAISDPLVRYFAMARGLQDRGAGVDVAALEMTKLFDTNYHYIVPELDPDQRFELDASKLVSELEEARALGVETRPVIVGPVTFLLLAKLAPGSPGGAGPLDLLERLLPVYEALLGELADRNVAWVQVDEPCLALDLDARAQDACRRAFARLAACARRPRVLLATYFGALGQNLSLAAESGADALHVDLVRAPEQLDAALAALPPSMSLSAGVVDGRNIWRADLDAAHRLVRRAVQALGPERVLVAPSCSLLHVPVDLSAETKLDAELRRWMAFAAQKLAELRALADAAATDAPSSALFDEARSALAARRASQRTRDPEVRARAAAVNDGMLRRASPFTERASKQRARFGLPAFPTTTIGSFPQTGDVRGARAALRAGRTTPEQYERFLKDETRRCVEKQEAIGLDVLVHGEFERNDMVEYFGEQLAGFAFTENGWVQSYGSRCVKPPVLFGDVSRPAAMTVAWSTFAQSLTARPVKGMLTGPVTILQWSFVRDDQPRSETCAQIALALRDEVADLEAAGIAMIQVDEPAIREGLPLRRDAWGAYLRWAVDAFRLATSGVRDETQIHTHMCYAEFGDILDAIAAMDADVLSIETSRSRMELLADFARFRYPNEIGPGVYDIHSPRVPTLDEMVDLLERAARVLPGHQLWVNPDCGLKTRGWPEVESALRNMVEAARIARERIARERLAGARA
ncbi:5-methyltetrahydropteroyltriglutamate--homocysteine S-methyltransferase [Sorangium sp. So ce1097]|uniref:5-methyltetrahydropteroyltriglutamate-- homocysteine S-methyltransferase n=1 Tax=Sorangium sp. So ce1097 TaxID=3133330 RepID=UPI003F608228